MYKVTHMSSLSFNTSSDRALPFVLVFALTIDISLLPRDSEDSLGATDPLMCEIYSLLD